MALEYPQKVKGAFHGVMKLTENHQFQKAYSAGRSFVSPLLVTYVRKNRLKRVRVGITTSKKIGNAVQRNRSRRIILEAYRSLLPEFRLVRQGYDFVFVARGKTPFVKMNAVRRAMLRQLLEAGVIR